MQPGPGPPAPPPTTAGSRPSFVVLAVGKPPRPGTLVAEVTDRLEARGVEVVVLLPHEDPAALARLLGARRPDLLLHRGLRDEALAGVLALQAAGVPCCPPPGAVALVGDRGRLTARLAGAGVPVPVSWRTEHWPDVQVVLRAGPRVLKRAEDAGGRASGVTLLADPTAPPPFPGPWLVQELVEGDGVDRKLYVMGERVRGLLKPGPLLGDPAPVRAFDPDARLQGLARRVGRVLDLHLYGVDVVVGPDGPVVVDVNAVPGYRGVTGAPGEVVEHLLGEHLAAAP